MYHSKACWMYRYYRGVARLSMVCWALLAVPVAADDKLPVHYYSVQLENDSINNDSDGYYTSGIEFSSLRGEEESPAWLSTITNWIPVYRTSEYLNFVSYSLGQKIFTPRDTSFTTLQLNDRPYAAYLYANAAIMSGIEYKEGLDSGNMLELTLGLVGPGALGEEMQNTIHRLRQNDLSAGWKHQLQDELIAGMSYTRFWRMARPVGKTLQYGINSHYTLALGNAYTYGAVGMMFRLGDNLRRDLNPPSIRPGFPGVSYYRSLNGVDWYGFVGHELRWIERNIFLDGNSIVDSHRVEKEPVVGDTQFGVVFVHRDIRLSLSTTMRTKEFKTQDQDSVYRAITLSFHH